MEGEILISNIESEELLAVELMGDHQCLYKIGESQTFRLGFGELISRKSGSVFLAASQAIVR